MKKVILLLMSLILLEGCSFTSFEEDRPKTTYKRIMTPSGMQQESELPMGQIGFQSTPNKSDFVKIEVKDQHVIGRVHRDQEMPNQRDIEIKSNPKPDSTSAPNKDSDAPCDLRGGRECIAYKSFPLYEKLEDVPDIPVGKAMTCRVEGVDDKVFSCHVENGECFSAKLGEYCIQEK